jgi:hypothetical protein
MSGKSGSVALVVVLLGGCALNEGGTAEFEAVIPQQNQVAVEVPGGSGAASTSGPAGEHTLGVLGQTADFYALTRLTSERINGHVGFILAVLNAIVHYPASEVSGNSATWGPFTPTLSPVTWRLVVTREAPGQYSYHLDGRAKSSTAAADFVTVIDGQATPSSPPGRGTGGFSFDLTAAHQLDPVGSPGTGQIQVTYDFSANPRSIAVHFANLDDASGQPVSADYRYERADDQSGSFQFSAHGNMVGTAAQLEDGTIRSRWNAQGAGRADAHVSGGDAGAGLTLSECWDQNFARVYFSADPAVAATEGAVSACVFSDVLLPST